jgi:hypothetical protein
VFIKEEIEQKPKITSRLIPFIDREVEKTTTSSNKKEIDKIEKIRAIKRWKQSLGYYSLHPGKFKFRFKDFK